jgi:hypothetical protein
MNEELWNGTPASLACHPIISPVMTGRSMQHNPTQSITGDPSYTADGDTTRGNRGIGRQRERDPRHKTH